MKLGKVNTNIADYFLPLCKNWSLFSVKAIDKLVIAVETIE